MAHKRTVPLKNSTAVPGRHVPGSDIRINASGDDPGPIKRYSVDAAGMTGESSQTFSVGQSPYFAVGVITSRDSNIDTDV
jgi:hypothetical protein